MKAKNKMKLRRLKKEAKTEIKEAKEQLRHNLKNRRWLKTVLVSSVAIALYFIASLGLTFFQKALISSTLHYPITIVCCHLFLKFLFASSVRTVASKCQDKDRVVLKWRDYLSRVALVAVTSALDIGLSQWSFEFVTISLYTMTKASAVLWLLMFALFFGLEKRHWSLILIVSTIAVGLFLFVYRSTSFNAIGFSMAMAASVLSGARWTLCQVVMQKSQLGLENPVDFIYHIQPLMLLTLLPFAAAFEGLQFAASENGFGFTDYSVLLHTVTVIGFGGLLAFAMEVT